MAEAIAEMEAMDSVSRAGPNLHYEEDWTYRLQDTSRKKLLEPDPQTQTGEWLRHGGELQEAENQFHQRTREPEIEHLQDIRGEPKKRADHGRKAAESSTGPLPRGRAKGGPVQKREPPENSLSHLEPQLSVTPSSNPCTRGISQA